MELDATTAEPLANFIRTYLSVNRHGVCALYVDSIYEPSNANIKSHALMAKILSASVVSAPDELTVHRISLSPGPVNLKQIFQQMRGVNVDLEKAVKGYIFQATGVVEFSLVTGKYTSKAPLTKEKVRDFMIANGMTHDKIIQAELPFMPASPIRFDVKDTGDGAKRITFDTESTKRFPEILELLSEILGG